MVVSGPAADAQAKPSSERELVATGQCLTVFVVVIGGRAIGTISRTTVCGARWERVASMAFFSFVRFSGQQWLHGRLPQMCHSRCRLWLSLR